jgi:hypothetical protein
MNMQLQSPQKYLEQKQNLMLQRLDELRNELAIVDPDLLALNTGASFDRDQRVFSFEMMGKTVHLSFPGFQAHYPGVQKGLSTLNLALLLYYFFTADGTRISKDWIAFNQLPDGAFYHQAFQGYTGQEIKKRFEYDLEELKARALRSGGQPLDFADLAYKFQIFPRVDVALIVWLGDEELSSTFQILFNASTSHYLPTDACAIVGSTITHTLLA